MILVPWFILLASFAANVVGYNSGFWYGNTRPPDVIYESVPYANLTVKVNRSIESGPGENLVTDPLNIKDSLFVGNTINKQTFETQFILDLKYAIGINPNRVYVSKVTKGLVNFEWESTTVIVQFLILERNNTNEITLLEAIAELTHQIQIPNSKVYVGTNVTVDIDPLWGLQVINWDVSLKLMYAIQVVGGDAVQDGYYLNQGSLGLCDGYAEQNYSYYCEFERFFEDDVGKALNISTYRIQVLFIKSSAPDSVLVFFRISPPMRNSTEKSIAAAIGDLIQKVMYSGSPLFLGNVTIRTDPTWGVSNMLSVPRPGAAKFTKQYYDYDPTRLSNPLRSTQITAYDRCKQNRRCNWGIVELNQATNDARFFHQLFNFGTLYETNLFLDFEDWRMGCRGFSWDGNIPPTAPGQTSIPKARAADGVIVGAHFSPFNQPGLGPTVPCYLTQTNEGLVLDRSIQQIEIMQQNALVSDLEGRVNWYEQDIEFANMGADLRSRKDVRRNLTHVRAGFEHWLHNEIQELNELNSSQCVTVANCSITFNTSSLELTGVISGKGALQMTSNGTEVAVFTFNSIYLGPELAVRLVGQRALALISKTSAVINTTISAKPGTLGGFQGGGSVARYIEDSLSDNPRSIFICDLGDYCATPRSTNLPIISNNVNGPGSGNLRVNAFVIESTAKYIAEVQVIVTSALSGQSIGGGFFVKFKSFSTSLIPFDASAIQLQQSLEDNLNLVSPQSLITVNRSAPGVPLAGIGIVNVVRSSVDQEGGFSWYITFTTAIGNIDQMQVVSQLSGIGAQVSIYTQQDGNEITGTFALEFQGYSTVPILAYESAAGLQAKLLALPIVSTAYVDRTDPTGNCDDGLCSNGPLPCKGAIWTVYVTTNSSFDDITPTSPTSKLIYNAAPAYKFTSDTADLAGANSTISIFSGTSRSRENPENLLNITIPFSLAFGGSGGSYGGIGGLGYSSKPTSPPYNDELLTDLLGGSGGCMRSTSIFSINAILGASFGLGGDGGGAIEIIASNDLTIGSFGIIECKGGDGQESSQGGGGGGSGGAILLASGTTILMEGSLDVSGGSGGYGGNQISLSGGGGGGGRVAMYADSVTTTGSVVVNGGTCAKSNTNYLQNVTFYQAAVYMVYLLPLDDHDVAKLGKLFIEKTLQPISVETFDLEKFQINSTTHALLNLTFAIVTENGTFFQSIENKLTASALTNIAEVIMVQASIESSYSILTDQFNSNRIGCNNQGQPGTYYTQAKMTTSMYVRYTVAAENTTRALFFSNRETTYTSSGTEREAPFPWNGPIVPFEASQPVRITYYTKTDSVAGISTDIQFGSLFSLISRGESGLNISNVIGVYFSNAIMQGANFGSSVDEKVFLKRLVTIDSYPILNRWYKIDIFIQWENQTYSVAIDDQIAATKQPFVGKDVDGIRLSVYRAVDVWFDEIYVGFDNTMGFSCPITLRTGTSTDAPVQKHWSFEEVHGGNSNGYTEYYHMSRHYNFLSTVGSIPFDGNGEVKDNQDIKLEYADGDYPLTQGLVHAGALVYLTESLRSAKTPLDASYTLVSDIGLWNGAADGIGGAGDGRQFWYTEYNYNSTLSSVLNGGVAVCSSQDLISWRFEGITLHYTNLSDMVYGYPGPFYVERPKVLFNPLTSNYVMWAVMDNSSRTLAYSAIASSPYEDGPFLFRRSFYPDGNLTRDQNIFVNENNQPILARTYYQTVEYILPEAVMQPTWESAKSRAGLINFRSNYQRSTYTIDYDDYNDIYNQRWRLENIPYKVYCQNKITGNITYVPEGKYNSDGFTCNDPEETKVIIGLGNPIITSRFVSPNDTENSWWRPTSVPSVKAQPWASNYRDGYCGIRKLNDDYGVDDPNLATFVPSNRGNCSNIADNPIHSSLQDKLIGILQVVTTRRAKYIAISELTPDYLDTSGFLNSFEGELESGDLISMIVSMGQFGFGVGSNISSTFKAPVRSEYETAIDYKTRFYQYIYNHNDRATYSLACVLDGICPVNFKNQLTSGNY